MAIPYAWSLALQSIRKDKWINILSMLTIFAGLFIISLGFFIFYNIDAATRNLPERFSMVVYLDNGLSQEQIGQVISEIRTKKSVSAVKFISKEEAFKELKSTLRNSPYIMEGIDENPLPDSMEVKLRKDAMASGSVKQLADEISKIKGVDELDYGEKFLSALHEIKKGVRTAGMIMATVLSIGIVFVCYSTVKILFYRRNEEIETFKLLGATRGFIRAPFLIEGAMIGMAGGVISLVAIFLLHHLVILRMAASVPVFSSLLFPSALFFPLPLIGLLLGVFGAAAALGRLKY